MRRSSAQLIVLLAVAVVAAACGASGPSSVATTLETPTPGATPTSGPASQPPAETGSPEPVATPALTAIPSAAPTGSEGPTPGTSATPGASATPGDLASCTGTDANRDFLATATAAFSWEVYCAVLPSGWYVYDGRYRGASGGWMEIFYRNSAGQRFQLREGGFCTGTPAECGPLDSTLGAGSFGDLSGELGQYAGNYVLYVAPGTLPAYQATGVGLSEATFRAFLGTLVKLPG